MALKTAEIESILDNKGLVKSASSIGFGVDPGSNALGEGHVDYQFKNVNLAVGEGVITLTRVGNKAADTEFNCVDVITTTNMACLGAVKIPGYVFTADFSGCVFYLYRGDPTHVIGVHAHQGLETVQTTKKHGPFKLMKKVINQEVRKEYGPAEYMDTRAKKLLCRHETRGELTDQEKTGGTRHFMAFLSCVELDRATTFLYVYAGGAEGNRVTRVVHKFVDEF
jgi:hypothetical protein